MRKEIHHQKTPPEFTHAVVPVTDREGQRSSPRKSPVQRRKQTAQALVIRVTLLVLLMAGVAYCSWLAPWAKPVRTLRVEMGMQGGSGK